MGATGEESDESHAVTTSRREFARHVGYVAAGAVVVVPIALVAASWVPLDPAPRLAGSGKDEATAPTGREQRRAQDKEPKQRPSREERKAKGSS
jgi:hypothetical protein